MKAVRLLNKALRDSEKSRRDESLIAVIVLGYYEVCTLFVRRAFHAAADLLTRHLHAKKKNVSSIGKPTSAAPGTC